VGGNEQRALSSPAALTQPLHGCDLGMERRWSGYWSASSSTATCRPRRVR